MMIYYMSEYWKQIDGLGHIEINMTGCKNKPLEIMQNFGSFTCIQIIYERVAAL